MSRQPSGSDDLPAAGLHPVDPPATGEPPADTSADQAAPVENMLPRRGSRRFAVERLVVRIVATCGIVGIGVALGAILASSKVQGWIIGLVVALLSVILSAILWSSREV